MIRVTDDGPGIALEQQAHVFKRFYRAGSATRRRSLGLGLSIAKAVLKSQRGDIHLRSEPGAGCCFTLILPRLSERLVHGEAGIPAGSSDLREELTLK
jgi:two-component system OmpR family sensor kinase